MNSCVLSDWSNVPGENINQINFLKKRLEDGRKNKCKHQMVFMHHPLFGQDPNEKDNHMILPKSQRLIFLDLLEKYKKARTVGKDEAFYSGDGSKVSSKDDIELPNPIGP